jgi:hypothetical protein
MPRGVHRALQWLATDEETGLQALVLTAILQTYADWPNGSLMTHGLIHVYPRWARIRSPRLVDGYT